MLRQVFTPRLFYRIISPLTFLMVQFPLICGKESTFHAHPQCIAGWIFRILNHCNGNVAIKIHVWTYRFVLSDSCFGIVFHVLTPRILHLRSPYPSFFMRGYDPIPYPLKTMRGCVPIPEGLSDFLEVGLISGVGGVELTLVSIGRLYLQLWKSLSNGFFHTLQCSGKGIP